MTVGRSLRLSALALIVASCGEKLPQPPEISGPPCAVTSAAAFASEKRKIRTFPFNDVTIRFRGGHASCKAFHRASVCHFSAPRMLHVSRKGEEWWFNPGAGERVVLAVVEGRPRCVIGPPQNVADWAREHMQAPRPFER